MKLSIRGLSKCFGEHRALAAVSLGLESVASLVFMGPSGGGKTTLLRILAGLEFPDEGTIVIDSKPHVFRRKELAEHRRSVGVVFQAVNLFPHLSALKNILLPLEKVHGRSAVEAEEIAQSLLRRFRLEKHAHKRPAELSGGQRQRVAIVRAVAINPRLLFFDEPTSALDPEMTAEVLEMIEELKREGKDFVLVTHQMAFARRVADRIAFLAEGRLLECGLAEQIFNDPKTEECQQFLARVLKY